MTITEIKKRILPILKKYGVKKPLFLALLLETNKLKAAI